MGPRGPPGPPGKNGEDVSTLILTYNSFWTERLFSKDHSDHASFPVICRVSLANPVVVVSVVPLAHRSVYPHRSFPGIVVIHLMPVYYIFFASCYFFRVPVASLELPDFLASRDTE